MYERNSSFITRMKHVNDINQPILSKKKKTSQKAIIPYKITRITIHYNIRKKIIIIHVIAKMSIINGFMIPDELRYVNGYDVSK